MHLVYTVTTCSDRLYKELFANTSNKPAFQSQKYHRLLIEGLSTHADVDVVATLPLNRSLMGESKVSPAAEAEGGATYHYVTAYRNPVRKLLHNFVGAFLMTVKLTHKGDAVIIDCLNRMTGCAGLLAAKFRNARCVGIVTDLPDMLGGSVFARKIANYLIAKCSDYVFLTEAMNKRLNSNGKPYVILEGHCDSSMADLHPDLNRKEYPRVCLYAGGVFRKYGLDYLVEGFRMADVANTRLDIYGTGDYVSEIERISKEDSRIRYGGMLFSSEVVAKEMGATLLINPRPTHEEFVKYSFPSKTMEYMASGTPVLTTALPGMPKEYHPYLYLINEETADGIADVLKTVFSFSDAELFQKGESARQFVLQWKNNRVQAKKIINLLQDTACLQNRGKK